MSSINFSWSAKQSNKPVVIYFNASAVIDSFIEVDENARLSLDKLQRLGWKFRPLEETLIDFVQSYVEAGLLDSN